MDSLAYKNIFDCVYSFFLKFDFIEGYFPCICPKKNLVESVQNNHFIAIAFTEKIKV